MNSLKKNHKGILQKLNPLLLLNSIHLQRGSGRHRLQKFLHSQVQAVVAFSGSGVVLHECSILVLILNTKEVFYSKWGVCWHRSQWIQYHFATDLSREFRLEIIVHMAIWVIYSFRMMSIPKTSIFCSWIMSFRVPWSKFSLVRLSGLYVTLSDPGLI